jgi:FlaA1/EpsC-like NDP-sugar epimerase
MLRQFRNTKFYLMLTADALVFVVALVGAYLLRLDFVLTDFRAEQITRLLPVVVTLKLLVFLAFGLYRGMWRYTSLRDIFRILQASAVSAMLIVSYLVYRNRFAHHSRSILILDALLTFVLATGLRATIRLILAAPLPLNGARTWRWRWSRPRARTGHRVVIVGAGNAGNSIFHEIEQNPHLPYEVVCFLDDAADKRGRMLQGLPVHGPIDTLPEIVREHQIQEVLIAIPSATGAQMRRIVDLCEKAAVPFKTLPDMGAIIDGRVTMQTLRSVDYEDLLGRSPVNLDTDHIRNCLLGQRILVTGCGGSIGSELCRQLIRFEPSQIILWDANEANLYQVQMELEHERKFHGYVPILGQIQQPGLMQRVFAEYKPRLVFHAAAYKHVPLLEQSPWNAILNNVRASQDLMEMARQHNVSRFVLVSTDKAVRPTNVMGTSKRLTELILQAQPPGATRFMAVRFGNVIGSAGSVIPLFRRQIERGGPVTVTHPEVTRYFMLIPEAAQLILQAGSMGTGGEIFILDMGTPVRIVDMARDLIRLSGKEPDLDIPIVFTGLRPGEKLYEELITQGEGIVATHHEKIRVIRPDDRHLENARALMTRLPALYEAAEAHDAGRIRTHLEALVPEYAAGHADAVLTPV